MDNSHSDIYYYLENISSISYLKVKKFYFKDLIIVNYILKDNLIFNLNFTSNLFLKNFTLKITKNSKSIVINYLYNETSKSGKIIFNFNFKNKKNIIFKKKLTITNISYLYQILNKISPLIKKRLDYELNTSIFDQINEYLNLIINLENKKGNNFYAKY